MPDRDAGPLTTNSTDTTTDPGADSLAIEVPQRRSLPVRVLLRSFRFSKPWVRRMVILVFLTGIGVMLGHGMRTRFVLPDLHPWHTVVLHEEYQADRFKRPKNLAEYMELEKRLFAELDSKIYDSEEHRDTSTVGRYNPKSPPGILARSSPWNRTQILEPLSGPRRGAALLIHGMTDSPYSMKASADVLRQAGFVVVTLRLPGHGTIPSALYRLESEDLIAAVDLAAREVATLVPEGKPFWIGGYSTGATLALLHCLDAEEPVRKPTRLLLLSPAVGISEFAGLSDILSSVAVIPAFHKAAWLDILAEYDPYKINSFPLNAGKQVYRLTKSLDRHLRVAAKLPPEQRLDLPPILSIQSLMDATVRPDAVANSLFANLRPGNHEMVVFDLNPKSPWRDAYPAPKAHDRLIQVLGKPPYSWTLTLLTSESADGGAFPDKSPLREIRLLPGADAPTSRTLNMVWPPGLISLSHVAIPFPPEDPVYGIWPSDQPGQPAWPLGAATPRGERGAVPMDLRAFHRLRSNPFWKDTAERIRTLAERDAAAANALSGN